MACSALYIKCRQAGGRMESIQCQGIVNTTPPGSFGLLLLLKVWCVCVCFNGQSNLGPYYRMPGMQGFVYTTPALHLLIKKYAKSCFIVKNLILTSQQHVEHPFTDRNTQQLLFQ